MKKLFSLLMAITLIFSFAILSVNAADNDYKQPSSMTSDELDKYVSPMSEEKLEKYINSLSDKEIAEFLMKRYGFEPTNIADFSKEENRALDIELIKIQEKAIKSQAAQKAEQAKKAQEAQKSQSQGASNNNSSAPSRFKPTGDSNIDAIAMNAAQKWLYPTQIFGGNSLGLWQGDLFSASTPKEVEMGLFDAVAKGYIKVENLPAESKRFYDYGKRNFDSRRFIWGQGMAKDVYSPSVKFERKENGNWIVKEYFNPTSLSLEDAVGLGYIKLEDISKHDKKLIDAGALYHFSTNDKKIHIEDTEIYDDAVVVGLGLRTYKDYLQVKEKVEKNGWEMAYFDMEDMLYHIKQDTGKRGKWGEIYWRRGTEKDFN